MAKSEAVLKAKEVLAQADRVVADAHAKLVEAKQQRVAAADLVRVAKFETKKAPKAEAQA